MPCSLFAIRHSQFIGRIVVAALLVVSVLTSDDARGASPLDLVLSAEARRIETIERIAPSVVCIHDTNQRAGGSGVLIDPEGYGLTNYHVVASLLGTRTGWGGLADGVLYELEVLGIDVTGDVAMFRLIPPQPRFKFPYARLGDSDAVKVGDTAIAIGNPFSLSEDYTPTITVGIVTGVHRYQKGVGGNLAYTDSIQVDAAINPGNSGGPLFNAAGEIVGINGRISVNTRGRFNVGFGYAISSNQIQRFIPALRAGLLARHGTWQATVDDDAGKVRFAEVRRSGPAYDAGVRVGDRLLSLDGLTIQSANQVASMLGTYPVNWPVWLEIERGRRQKTDAPLEVVVRLEAVQPTMRRPFEVDRNVNLRQVERVLRAYRRSVLGDETARRPSRWNWTSVRHHMLTEEQLSGCGVDSPTGQLTGSNTCYTPPRQPEHFEVSQTGDGPIRMEQRDIDGSAGRIIEYDDVTAVQRVSENEESYDLPADVNMVLGALYTMQRWLLEPVDQIDLSQVSHAGADGYVEPLSARRWEGGGATSVLEVIAWPLGEHAVARFAFDSESFTLTRITTLDLLSGASATIDFSDHRDVGGSVWPCTLEVRGDGYAYCETLSDWELSP